MEQTQVLGNIVIERLHGGSFVRLQRLFLFYSTILGRWSCIPVGFVYDEESVPLLKGTNPESGAIHDYLCRVDSDPCVTKDVAAQVYYEFQAYYDNLDRGWFMRTWNLIKRKLKTKVVEMAPGYFHKYRVNATYEELLEDC
jgi:hypothetical protein